MFNTVLNKGCCEGVNTGIHFNPMYRVCQRRADIEVVRVARHIDRILYEYWNHTTLNRYISQIPQCTSSTSHNAAQNNKNVHMCAGTFLLWSGALMDTV